MYVKINSYDYHSLHSYLSQKFIHSINNSPLIQASKDMDPVKWWNIFIIVKLCSSVLKLVSPEEQIYETKPFKC